MGDEDVMLLLRSHMMQDPKLRGVFISVINDEASNQLPYFAVYGHKYESGNDGIFSDFTKQNITQCKDLAAK